MKTLYRERVIKGASTSVLGAVSILPIDENSQVTLVIQPRPFTTNTVTLELPAGYIDIGEKPLIAAIRELKEETGLTFSTSKHLGSYYQDQGASSTINHMYLMEGCKQVYTQNLDHDEYIKLFTCSIEELYYLLDNGYINDGGSMLTLRSAISYIKKYRHMMI